MEAKAHQIICSVLVEKDDKFLLVQEAQEKCRGKWCVPTGHLDAGETLFEAAIREAREESGCEVALAGLCSVVQIEHAENSQAIAFIFAANLLRENLGYDTEEILDVRWFSYDEILAQRDQLRMPEGIINALDNYRAGTIAPLTIFNLGDTK